MLHRAQIHNVGRLPPLPPQGLPPLDKVSVITNAQQYPGVGIGEVVAPGVLNALTAPASVSEIWRKLSEAKKCFDWEGVAEYRLRLYAQVPTAFTHAILQVAFLGIEGAHFFNLFGPSHIVKYLLFPSNALFLVIVSLALLLCAISASLEILGLVNNARFMRKICPEQIKELKKAIEEIEEAAKKGNISPEFAQDKIQKIVEVLPKGVAFPEMLQALNKYVEALPDAEKSIISPNENQTKAIQDKASIAKQQILLSQLKNLEQRYFKASPKDNALIERYIRDNPELDSLPPIDKQDVKEKITKSLVIGKEQEFTRRVHPWLYEETKGALPDLTRDLSSKDSVKRAEAAAKAERLFTDIEVQAKKERLMYALGLLAIVTIAAGLIALCIATHFAFPFLAIPVVMGLGALLATSRSVVHFGYRNSRGWEFSIFHCAQGFLPAPVLKVVEDVVYRIIGRYGCRMDNALVKKEEEARELAEEKAQAELDWEKLRDQANQGSTYQFTKDELRQIKKQQASRNWLAGYA